jgi:hypothetical protein
MAVGAFTLGVGVGYMLRRPPPLRRSSVELRGRGTVRPGRRGRHRAR